MLKRLAEASTLGVTQIYAHEIMAHRDDLLDGKKLLSMDCFDTLLWRNLATPKDLFFLLEDTQVGRRFGLTAKLRAGAERAARYERKLADGCAEISLDDIYKRVFPKASEADIAELVQQELQKEQEHCFIFTPALDLLQAAHDRGIKTMLVSDIYMSQSQLESLVRGAIKKIGRECPIDAFFASSDYRQSKSEGLLRTATKKMSVSPERVVHIGDNLAADVAGANSVGVKGVLLKQFDEKTSHLIRNTHAMASFLGKEVRQKRPIFSTWHGIWARQPAPTNGIETLARFSLAPSFIHYSLWLADQVRDLREKGEHPHIVFMLRDGFMPARVFEKIAAADPTLTDVTFSELETSRFVGFLCSFNDRNSVLRYLEFLGSSGQCSCEMALRQFLFSDEDIKRVSSYYKSTEKDFERFVSDMTREPYLSQILENAQKFRDRYTARITSIITPQKNETLILADLGYAGTIQTLMSDYLKETFGVKVRGSYLLLQDSLQGKEDKFGLLDETEEDFRSINMLLSHIQTLEQLSCNQLPSVINFEPDGSPVYALDVVSPEQRSLRTAVQEETLEMVDWLVNENLLPISSDHREALSNLGRMLIYPDLDEVVMFRSCVHDANLGTEDTNLLIDIPRARENILRHGMVSVSKSQRYSTPHELRGLSLEQLTLYLATNRLDLDFRASDFVALNKTLTVTVVLKNGKMISVEQQIFQTGAGFETIYVPLTASTNAIGFMFGRMGKWFQLESVRLDHAAMIMGPSKSTVMVPKSHIHLDALAERGEGLFECQSEQGFMLVDMSNGTGSKDGLVLAMTFRFLDLH